MEEQFDGVDKSLIPEVKQVLDMIGLEVSDVINFLFKRIRKEGNVNFLLTKSAAETEDVEKRLALVDESEQEKMTKSKAVALLRQSGQSLSGPITFASKNKSADNYWANPSFEVLNDHWNLILNDWKNREIYLFTIPAHSIGSNRLVYRADKPHQIDLQIMYRDQSFTDMRSKVSFAQFLVTSLKY